MARPARQTKPESDKRKRIIDAAIRVFARKGFYNSKVVDVAGDAGVAEGTIYLYFKNKDDLLISIFEDSMNMFTSALQKELEGATDPVEKLRRLINLHLTLVEKNQDLAEVLQVELRQSSKFMKEYKGGKFLEYLNLVQSVLEEGQSKGIFRDDIDLVVLRRAFFGALDEISLGWVLSKKRKITMEACAKQLSDMFIFGISK